MKTLWLAVLFVAYNAQPLSAQTTDGGYDKLLSTSLASVANAMHTSIRTNLAEAAEAMTDADYSFRPTTEVRTFAELVGHIANANFFFCSQAVGEKPPATQNYETVSKRAVILAGLRESLAYCDKVYQSTTDASFGAPVRMAGAAGVAPTDTTRGAVLMFNVTHNNEHYGNVVVYMRLRGRVPPSTARAQRAR